MAAIVKAALDREPTGLTTGDRGERTHPEGRVVEVVPVVQRGEGTKPRERLVTAQESGLAGAVFADEERHPADLAGLLAGEAAYILQGEAPGVDHRVVLFAPTMRRRKFLARRARSSSATRRAGRRGISRSIG